MFSRPSMNSFPSHYESATFDCNTFPSNPPKKQRFSDNPLLFSPDDIRDLQRAAAILNVTLDSLLVLATAASQPTSTQSSPQQHNRNIPLENYPQANNMPQTSPMFTLVTATSRRGSNSPSTDQYNQSTSHFNPTNPAEATRGYTRAPSVPESFDVAATNTFSIEMDEGSDLQRGDFSELYDARFNMAELSPLTTKPSMPQVLTATPMMTDMVPTCNEYGSGLFLGPKPPFTTAFDTDANPQMRQPNDTLAIQMESSPTNETQGKKRKRGPFRNPEQRRDTGRTRELVACISCSMQRIRCDFDPNNPKGCCLTCIKSAPIRIYQNLPCIRLKIPDVELLDHAICPRPTWTRRWKEMKVTDIPAKHWASQELRTITITQDVGGGSYQLKVRQFRPMPELGDELERKWVTNGKPKSYKCAPYAIADMREAGQILSNYADQTLQTAIAHYIDKTDALLCSTYWTAYRYSMNAESEEERELLRKVLRLWCASRMESRSDRIDGHETLGMTPHFCDPDCGPECPNTQKILTPPVFSAQLEVIMVATILQPMKKEVLHRLKKLMEKNHRRSWFTIYLTMFILLHSCSMLTAGDNKKARKQGLDPRSHRFFRNSVVEGLHNGAKILLAFFHYCNKGSRPFSMDWSSPDQVARTELSPDQVEFMRLTSAEIQRRTPHFRQIRATKYYEDDYYFISQLYDADWDPKKVV